MRSVPGVLVDRVNIGGNETGQQSNFQAKGTRPQDATWTLDGVEVTDMAATGASPTYFNYDNFDEIQVSTAGNDIKTRTGGMGLNFVVKRGTNQYRGTARGYFTNDGLESSNVPDELVALGITPETADHNDQITDYGFDLGGPIVRDRAWVWGSWTKQDIRLIRSAGNIRDGLITDAIKSAGAAKKGGSSPVTDVIDYPGRVTKPGLALLCTPGSDVESTTAEVGAGANIVLFTTGLGTPTGNPVTPVLKLSTNTKLANKMQDIIDLDTGTIINGANEGQAAALADIWTDEAFLSYSEPSQDVKALNFARTFNWTAADGSGPAGISTFTYDENEIDSRVVRARQFTDEKVVAAGAGYYFSNVLA